MKSSRLSDIGSLACEKAVKYKGTDKKFPRQKHKLRNTRQAGVQRLRMECSAFNEEIRDRRRARETLKITSSSSREVEERR
jgi:hypothetical protein